MEDGLKQASFCEDVIHFYRILDWNGACNVRQNKVQRRHRTRHRSDSANMPRLLKHAGAPHSRIRRSSFCARAQERAPGRALPREARPTRFSEIIRRMEHFVLSRSKHLRSSQSDTARGDQHRDILSVLDSVSTCSEGMTCTLPLHAGPNCKKAALHCGVR